MKNFFLAITALGVVLLVGIQLLGTPEKLKIGGTWYASGENLIGSSSNLVGIPTSAVFADATTTNPSEMQADRGSTIDQLIDTNGFEMVLLNIQAIGGTATSTLHIHQMGSQDGTTYYELVKIPTIATTSTPTGVTTQTQNYNIATSTILTYKTVVDYAPGTATATPISVPFYTNGYRFTRFVIYGDDASTDPGDFVQAWINAIKVENANR